MHGDDIQSLGDYSIVKQIGHGALGKVYLAEHRFIKRPYMLKVLPEELSGDRQFMQRFQDEVKLLASLEHPNIVQVHNVSYDNGRYFLVTDCVVDEIGETCNLAQYLAAQERSLAEEAIQTILEQVAEGLDYVHSKRTHGEPMVHGGLKLNNILITGRGSKLKVAISDAGLSTIIGPGAVLTRTYKMVADALQIAQLDEYPNPAVETTKLGPLHNSFLQTFAFLAPEQRRSGRGGATPAADSYAFGVLAYYLVTGHFPEGWLDVPSTEGGYGPRWDAMIQACLQRDPVRRPETLTAALSHTPKPVSTPVVHTPADHVPEPVKMQPIEPVPAPAPVPQAEVAMAAAPAPAPVAPAAPAPQPRLGESELKAPEYDPDPAQAFHVDNQVTTYNPATKVQEDVEPLLSDMVVITGGVFTRGSSEGNRDEMPTHEVDLASFAIDVHPVTNEQFIRYLQALGGEKDHNNHDIIKLKESRIRMSRGKYIIESGYAKHPVVGVSWYGAVGYAKWIGKRLPTEAEWEAAARGGLDHNPYPLGEGIEKTQANFFSSDTTAVMSYPSNGYGLYEMAGNVYEWCQDWYGYDFYYTSQQEPEDPAGPVQGVYRVLRGGCWKKFEGRSACVASPQEQSGRVQPYLWLPLRCRCRLTRRGLRRTAALKPWLPRAPIAGCSTRLSYIFDEKRAFAYSEQ